MMSGFVVVVISRFIVETKYFSEKRILYILVYSLLRRWKTYEHFIKANKQIKK